MENAVDDVLRQIASVNGVAIGKDDPIMMVVTMMLTVQDGLAAKSEASHAVLLAKTKSELEDMAQRWGQDAKEKADRTLTAALNASKVAMAETLQQSAVTTAAVIKAEVDAATLQLSQSAARTRQAAYTALVAAAVTTATAFVCLVAGVFPRWF